MVLGEQQLGGVGHFAQPVLPHLVDAQLRSAAETVLDAAEDAVDVVLVALELDDGIDDMLQYFGAGQRTLLVDVANEQHRHSASFCKMQERRGALPDLSDAARGGVGLLGGDGLNGVDDHQLGMNVENVGVDFLQRVLTQYIYRVTYTAAQTLRTHLDLMGTLFSADIKHTQLRHLQDGLQRER